MSRYFIGVVLSLLIGLLAIGFFLDLPRPVTALVADDQVQVIEPAGGGEFKFQPRDEISDADRRLIQAEIARNTARLEKEGKLAPAVPLDVPLSWPIAKAPGVLDFNVIGISNFVDHNAAFPNQLQDYNCGTRTYDLSSGYNHKGIDIFTWPFGWNKMDNNEVVIVASAPGTIISKTDGNFDRSCAIGSGQWNAVYVRHADNSVAWYGHMKSGSTTSKAVGATVAAGEYLGVVGSSGSSTGPHLHFELYGGDNLLKDPYSGPCNSMNTASWWAAQEAYRVPKINRLMTGSAGPTFPTCPTPEVTNEKRIFKRGDALTTSAYYRDQTTGHVTQFALLRPDGSTHSNWQHTSPNTYNASYWFWSWTIPANARGGQWKFRATYQTVQYEMPFTVVGGPPFDFDGDGKTDVGIFRPGPAEWWYRRSSDGQVPALQFGTSTDAIAPVDYTGDGKSDVAFFRPTTGEWFILRSEDGSFYSFPFGGAGDTPVPADYDGDGKGDVAVFRSTNNTWYIQRSSDLGVSIITFGASGDLPVTADYDGDGKSDIGIFRPGPGEWWYLRSSDGGNRAFQFGTSTDKTVVGDYTGDGKADAAFFRPTTGEWFILRSEDGSFYSFPFGGAGDTPVPGDYDGDGKTDAAVFRPSSATWFMLGSTSGTQIIPFGAATDRPIPNAFVR
ncbi:MAG TPA: FG-GAP-like repeat-containing protein [Pyrinomonadaceae bacterium]|nr:VCBS repeat domain-containing M23 family metallopeptidase [Chloracidobacterium sp.]HRJ88728.1 FG-GAP-like repeat-containing protein [Pyrinomonadaceae bacterium]